MLAWADDVRRLRVRANADTPEDAAKAREFGAEGIGLCRTEHMFFGEERLPVVQRMILAEDRAGAPRGARPAAADAAVRLRGHLRGDGRAAGDDPAARPAAARVPADEEQATDEQDAPPHPRAARGEPDARHARLPARADVPRDLRDAGARDRARRRSRSGRRRARRRSSRSCTRSSASTRSCAGCAGSPARRGRGGRRSSYLVRDDDRASARVRARDEIAHHADFFSFGTNDLTQTRSASRATTPRASSSRTTSRTASSRRTRSRRSTREGVGDADAHRGRARPRGEADLKLGICGEHGGEPRSVAFCHELGLDYVSCSPFRVPVARLAAAQAALAESGGPSTSPPAAKAPPSALDQDLVDRLPHDVRHR